MSYDIAITAVRRTQVYSDNHTYNCSAMFRMAIGQDGLWALNGLPVADVRSQLNRAYKHMTDPKNRAKYEELAPANGWGSHESAIRCLLGLVIGCEENPEGIIYID